MAKCSGMNISISFRGTTDSAALMLISHRHASVVKQDDGQRSWSLH